MAYKQGFVDGAQNLKEMRKEAFIDGIEASKTIEWTRESEEIKRVLKEWGYQAIKLLIQSCVIGRTDRKETDMKYILCDEKGNEVKVGNDYDFADFVNAVYANDGWFFLDEKGNIVEC